MKWAIDIDGVITANPQAMSWLTHHLCKNENKQEVLIVTWRDGSDPVRVEQTLRELETFGIFYNEIVMAPRKFTDAKTAAFWKIAKITELGINIWVDDELKMYRRDFGIDLDLLLPKVEKIWI